MPVYAVFCSPFDRWLVSEPNTRQHYWHDHVEYVNELLKSRTILIGGTYSDFSRILMVIEAENEAVVRSILAEDPLIKNRVTMIDSIIEWMLYSSRSLDGGGPD